MAIDPPAALSEELAAWARRAVAGPGARSVRLLAPETMHLTLCFLGGRPLAELTTTVAAVESLTAAGAELSLGAPLWLPPRRPRTLALAVHDRGGELARLRQAVALALAGAIDWQPERRRFRGHVTVARMRERSRSGRDGVRELVLPATPQRSFTACEVVLYRSRPAPTGVRYEPLAARALAMPSEPSLEGAEGRAEPGAP